MRSAIDLGVTVFDTADAYGAGASEHVLGRAAEGPSRRGGHRDEGRIRLSRSLPAEQLGPPLGEDGACRLRRGQASVIGARRRPSTLNRTSPLGTSATRCTPACGGSRTDHIDVYQLHAPTHVLPDLVEQLVRPRRRRRRRAFRGWRSDRRSRRRRLDRGARHQCACRCRSASSTLRRHRRPSRSPGSTAERFGRGESSAAASSLLADRACGSRRVSEVGSDPGAATRSRPTPDSTSISWRSASSVLTRTSRLDRARREHVGCSISSETWSCSRNRRSTTSCSAPCSSA